VKEGKGGRIEKEGTGKNLGVATKCGVRTIVGVSTAIPEVVHRIKSVASLANGNCGARREIDPGRKGGNY
jgi:hypothetical protein